MSNVRIPVRFRLLLLVSLTISPWFFSNGQDATAVDSLRETLSQARKSLQEEDFPAAIVRYEQYLSLKPKDNDVRNELARTFSWNSEYDSAIAQYNVVIRNNGDNFDAHFGRCQVLAWKHDYRGALEEVETLLILSPMNIDVDLLAGRIYAWNKDFARSLEMYQKALGLDDLNVEALVGKCRALEGLGRTKEAFSEITDARSRLPDNATIQQVYEQLIPRPKNQLYAGFQEESFDVTDRSDHRTFTAQYYRTLRSDLTLYAEFDEYRRFDEDDQSLGIGAYWNVAERQSLYAYCLVSPNPRVTSTVDCSFEFAQRITNPLNIFLAYRLLDFKTETAHILSPGFSLEIGKGIMIRPRIYVSRTVITRATSVTYAVQMASDRFGRIRPFLYYAVGNEAYRGVTLDNVESSEAWSVTVGGRYEVTKELVVTAGYQYLNRIGFFRSNAVTLGAGYYW